MVAPATPADAKGLLKAAIRDDNPVIVLEGEMLYNTKGEVPEGEHVVPIGRAEVKRAGSDVTLICHSKTVTVALKAAEQLQEQNVSAEVLDLRSLRPMDEPAILESIAKTNRAVVVEEGWPHCGVGAQVVDIIQRDAFDQLDASGRPTRRCPTTSTSSAPRRPAPRRWWRRRGASSTSTDDGDHGPYGGALAHDGGRAPRQMDKAGRRSGQDGRDPGRGRNRQGGDGARRPGRRQSREDPGSRGEDGAGGSSGRVHRGAGRESQRREHCGARGASGRQ